jgi:hypothetical protein
MLVSVLSRAAHMWLGLKEKVRTPGMHGFVFRGTVLGDHWGHPFLL